MTGRPAAQWLTLLPPADVPPALVTLSTLAGLAGEYGPLTVAAVGTPRRLSFHLAAPGSVPSALLAATAGTALPGAELRATPCPLVDHGYVAAATWRPASGETGDVAAGIAAALGGLPEGQCGVVAATIRPARPTGRPRADRAGWLLGVVADVLYSLLTAARDTSTHRPRPAGEPEQPDGEARLEVTLRSAWLADEEDDAWAGHRALAALLEGAGLVAGRCRNPAVAAARIVDGRPDRRARRRGQMTPAALARVLRIPDRPPPTMQRLSSARRPAPRPLPAEGIALATATGGQPEPVGFTVEELTSHAYVLGPSGTGKSALLARLVAGLVSAGTGSIVLDPHGDLVRRVLAALPATRRVGVDVAEFTDPAQAVAINPLHEPTGDPQAQANRVAAMVAAFADIWQLTEATTPNLHRFLRLSLDTLMAGGSPRLADLAKVLDDLSFRRELLHRAADPRLTAEWQQFDKWSAYERTKAIRSVVNKAEVFDRDPVLRKVFGDPGPGLCIGDYLDTGRSLLVNLSRGRLAEGTGRLLGTLLMTMLHQAAMARENVAPELRRPAVAVLDEFHELGVTSFSKVVTATRKYRVGVVAANQNLASINALDRYLVESLLANAANLVAFRLSAEDARALAPSFPGVTAADLAGLGRFECYLRRQGPAGPEVTSARTLPPVEP